LSGGYAVIRNEVEHFFRYFGRLTRLPLISDAEMEGLFSPGLLETLARFRQYDTAEGICAGCPNRCCALIHCEVYEPAFGTCPVFSLRPLLCRMHYCSRFDVYREDIKTIGDIFLDSLMELENEGSRRTVFFDCPPFAAAAPELAEKMKSLTQSFRTGKLERAAALSAIQSEAENYRTVFQNM
jgi:hypothetical protein